MSTAPAGTIRVGQVCVLTSPAIDRVGQPTLTEDGGGPGLWSATLVMALTGALCRALFATTGIQQVLAP
jgi:hypothetical protein